MDRLRQLSPNVRLPTEAALRLSLEMLDAERPSPCPTWFADGHAGCLGAHVRRPPRHGASIASDGWKR